MDLDSLRAELEQQLAKIHHKDAPHGFRDRFDCVVECYQSDQDDFSKEVLEQELQQIRIEAEAAAKAGAGDAAGGRDTGGAEPRGEPAPPPRPVPAPRPEPAPAPSPDPEPGFLQRYGIAAVIIVIVLAAAYYFWR